MNIKKIKRNLEQQTLSQQIPTLKMISGIRRCIFAAIRVRASIDRPNGPEGIALEAQKHVSGPKRCELNTRRHLLVFL